MALSPVVATEATAWAVSAEGLTRRFGASRALNRVDLAIPWDQRTAILGHNGAGKSTLLRIVATLLRPTAGEIVVGGLRLPDQAGAVRRHLGFVGHQTFLYDDLTARENLVFYGRLYGVPRPGSRADDLLRRVGIADRADDRVRNLSRGLQQRVALARAIVHDPPILLLDEPETGLDLAGGDLLESFLRDDDKQPRTVLLTSHSVERAMALTDRVIVLWQGRIALDARTTGLDPAVVARAIRGDEQ